MLLKNKITENKNESDIINMHSDIIDIKYIPKILILFLDKIIDDGNNKIKKKSSKENLK
jgi:hypothetical protein